MILPTGTTVAVADGETVRLFHNTGVKPRVHLVEITAAPPAPAHSGSGTPVHKPRRLVEDDFAAATAAFPNKLSLERTGELPQLFGVRRFPELLRDIGQSTRCADDSISTDNDLDVVPTLSRHHRSGLSYRAATRNAEVSWRTVAFEGG